MKLENGLLERAGVKTPCLSLDVLDGRFDLRDKTIERRGGLHVFDALNFPERYKRGECEVWVVGQFAPARKIRILTAEVNHAGVIHADSSSARFPVALSKYSVL